MCIPSQEELKKRTEDRKKEGIELPENAVSDMKSKGYILRNNLGGGDSLIFNLRPISFLAICSQTHLWFRKQLL